MKTESQAFLTPEEKEFIIFCSAKERSLPNQEVSNPMNYLCLQKLFGDEKNEDILLSFINAILNKEGMHRVKYIQNWDLGYFRDGANVSQLKVSPVDVMCTDGFGEEVIVQIVTFRSFRERGPRLRDTLKKYAMDHYISDSCYADKNYKNLKKVYIIVLLAKNLVHDEEEIFDNDPVHVEPNENCEKIEIIYVEMEKFSVLFCNNEFDIKKIDSEQIKWGFFLSNIASRPLSINKNIESLCNAHDKIFNKATKVLNNWTSEQFHEYIRVESETWEKLLHEEYIYNMGKRAGEKQQRYQAYELAVTAPEGCTVPLYIEKSAQNSIVIGPEPEKKFPDNYIFLKNCIIPK